jgi:hypothetical protein
MFHVPEKYRVVTGRMGSNSKFGNNGAFRIPKPNGRLLWIIASDGLGWEHVSIHVEIRVSQGETKPQTPLWDEMCFVKDLFWDDDDVVMQLHPMKSEYVNNHPNTLHLWRPTEKEIPTPPSILVGVKGRS